MHCTRFAAAYLLVERGDHARDEARQRWAAHGLAAEHLGPRQGLQGISPQWCTLHMSLM